MKSLVSLTILFLLTVSQSLKLPSYITPCARSDPKFKECVIKSANMATETITKGDQKYRFPVLDPLEITQLLLDDTAGPIGLKMSFQNIKLIGLSKSIIEDFNFDFEKKYLKYVLFTPRLEMLCDYEVSGKILILPITGKGPGNITMTGFRDTFSQSFEFYKKPTGIVHIKMLDDASQNFTMEHSVMKLENLFGGNKLLGDQMNSFINDNIDMLLKEIGPPVGDAIMYSIQNGFNYLVDKVSFDDIFLP